ncbi:hypothetical protein AX15_004676 [Amanita polypyramis BW_CC]|nr:hypothetical protein AX15_004676 [Amanita polypyramis BW_CC]
MSSTESKNPNRVAGGYKATMANPNTSDEAKQSARERLEEMEPELESHHKRVAVEDVSGKNTGNVIGGHKANLNNPNTSQEAKEHSRQILEQANDNEKPLGDADYNPEEDE